VWNRVNIYPKIHICCTVEYYYYVKISLSIIVSDVERPDVSGPIRSIKMYSHAQCTMQERSMCCRDVPCLAHVDLGSGPLHPEHLPPSLSAWGNGDSVYLQPSRRMDLDSGVEICSQPNTDPVILDNVRDIIFIPSRKLVLECLSNHCLPSTDCCYIFRVINHNKK
jgi:hypothetical protein